MGDAFCAAIELEMVAELRTVIRLQMCQGNRSNMREHTHEVGGGLGGMRHVPVGKGELRFEINAGQDVPLDAVREAHNGIRLGERSGMPLAPRFGLGLPGVPLDESTGLARKGKTLRIRQFVSAFEIGKHLAHGGRREIGDAVLPEEDSELFLADLLHYPFRNDELLHRVGDDALPLPPGRGALRDKGFGFPASGIEQLLPAEERCPRYLERLFWLPHRHASARTRGCECVLPRIV